MPIRIQRFIALFSFLLFLGKLWAYYLTHSVTVLTDALESTINVIMGVISLYSVSLSARPRDTNHPYGHGKVEYISSAIEGTLISIAGVIIIYEAILHLLMPKELQKLDLGLIIIVVAGSLNYLVGRFAAAQGKKHHSIVLESGGRHLMSDAYSSFAIIIGLGLLLLTHDKWAWLDSAVAMCFACIIIITGYKILRRSISGIMDEVDIVLLKSVISLLQKNRVPQWVDLHNMRVLQYGTLLHIDAHMTLPWYYKVSDADSEIHALEGLIKSNFDQQVELFIHIDGCMPYQCKLCAVPECPVRKEAFKQQLEWSLENVWVDSKHGKELGTDVS